MRGVVVLALWLSVFLLSGVQNGFSAGRYSLLLQMVPVLSAVHAPVILPIDRSQGHKAITSWQGTATCLQCHQSEGNQVFASLHYQWLGTTPYMDDGPDLQGKLDLGVNSYCINITGNWDGCSACHVGLGARPSSTSSPQQLSNIDCLICHQDEYKRVRVGDRFLPDTVAMNLSLVDAAKTVHLPSRLTCLQCHAKGGGGDNYKRGDLALAHASTADRNFDVHMATSGANLRCQACHHTDQHRIAGRGSDLRPTEIAKKVECITCHAEKGTPSGHENQYIGSHIAHVACQTCHIRAYARNASDTQASEQTEIHRDWRLPHQTASGAIHPTPTLAGNLTPRYKWWNGRSTSYLLHEQITVDPLTGAIPTSRPSGAIEQETAKIYPFKYKTATQPLASQRNQLIALDTSVYFTSGDVTAAIQSGLINMGYSVDEPWQWVETDTYQLVTHEVMPASQALQCGDCHGSTERMDLVGELGYRLQAERAVVCTQCHEQEDGEEDNAEYLWVHEEHVQEEGFDCSVCHVFSRPERNLRTTLSGDDD